VTATAYGWQLGHLLGRLAQHWDYLHEVRTPIGD
jgi:hypothetical protein